MENSAGLKILSGTSLVMAILQSVCTAVLTISGIRLTIGLTAFALSGSILAPVGWFHQDAIRIPMLLLATVGAVVDLAVLGWIRHLRAQPSAQWRKRERSAKQRRSERLQFTLALLTLLLVGLETWTHTIVARRAQAHPITQTSVRPDTKRS